MKQISIFAEENRLQKLSELGDCLERLNVVDFERFRPTIALAFEKERKSNAGRPPYDSVMLFKTIILERLYNLSEDQVEFQINDRRTFARFLGIEASDKVPDAKTIWLFKDTLTKSGVIELLFAQFNQMLEEKGLITHKGTIVDATFVDAPRQRNTRDETSRSRKEKHPRNGKMLPIKRHRRTRTPVGQRKATKHISDIRITSRQMPTANLSLTTQSRPPTYTTAMNLKTSSTTRTKSVMPTVPM